MVLWPRLIKTPFDYTWRYFSNSVDVWEKNITSDIDSLWNEIYYRSGQLTWITLSIKWQKKLSILNIRNFVNWISQLLMTHWGGDLFFSWLAHPNGGNRIKKCPLSICTSPLVTWTLNGVAFKLFNFVN